MSRPPSPLVNQSKQSFYIALCIPQGLASTQTKPQSGGISRTRGSSLGTHYSHLNFIIVENTEHLHPADEDEHYFEGFGLDLGDLGGRVRRWRWTPHQGFVPLSRDTEPSPPLMGYFSDPAIIVRHTECEIVSQIGTNTDDPQSAPEVSMEFTIVQLGAGSEDAIPGRLEIGFLQLNNVPMEWAVACLGQNMPVAAAAAGNNDVLRIGVMSWR